ncbi:MAG: translation initiation factor IF-3 [Oscillospiraceae bacterium]|nr:translation initiation factor IF-3 [Oscillospiraceae bacterium]MBQ6214253.1 translation initiation factor IF-3 [Oscillospiraceae bacterium]
MQRSCCNIANQVHEINEEITDREVRLIGADGEQLGIMSAEEALKHAEEQGYDLVKIAPNAVPPVCRIMDYGKFRFEQTKKEKEAKKNQHVIEIKEIRMSPHIDDNDFNTKVSAARKFLAQGNRVKVAVRFRGREMAHTEIGKEILENFARQCEDVAAMDKGAKLEGRMMSIFLSAKPTAPAKKSGKPKQPKQETPAEKPETAPETSEAVKED